MAVVSVVAATVTATSTATAADGCPQNGHLTYTIQKSSSPSADEADAYATLDKVLTKALAVYNCYTNITKSLRIVYAPGNVSTADANISGAIRFSDDRSYMQQATAMHEIAHSVGVGTHSTWRSHIVDGLWTGNAAVAELRAATGDPAAELHADSTHFWPYGLNYASEVTSDDDYVIHCKIVAALRQDMGMS